ncbi:MAG: 3-phenylpropionate/cinnamic acid dioxygenase subunit beta [Acidimicrobiia bacterium]|nr:3-phenylpropionate/cinnamic acid dioxygenase subunit beta [Acidimicrobiia bacterium]
MNAALDALALRLSIEEFLYLEAELLDDHRYDEWLTLLADDVHYWAPTQANRLRRDRGREASALGEVALFDDDKTTLGWRVRQMGLATHWAEDPPSRTRHLVSNIRIAPGDGARELAVRSNFLCYRNRLRDEVDLWAGERHDVLRRVELGVGGDGGGPGWLIARRAITLDQNVVLSKNLSVFF